MIQHHIDIQQACDEPLPIQEQQFQQWADLALAEEPKAVELTLRFVDVDEMTTLNETYRKKTGPTNVLAFPAVYPSTIELDHPLLGDVIICPSVLARESIEMNKPADAHFAHIVLHGILHLLGYNHIEAEETALMQTLEIKLLQQLGYPNPYLTEDTH